MAIPKKKQDPADRLDYLINWQKPPKPFLAEGEVISTSVWTAHTEAWAATSDLTLTADTHDDTTSVVFVAGGTKGLKYHITNHIVTDQGREKDESFQLIIEEQ